VRFTDRLSGLNTSGESGSGKSALVCNWALGYVEKYKTERLVVTHYIGSTAQSTDLAGLLRRFCSLLSLSTATFVFAGLCSTLRS
jgi:hypothetical protein